ncbi:MAG: YqjK family protein [Sulfuricaulis sp.]|uniref:YqjK family protein n=1 Tax=Sulfuricaulis sp. TaxID=2003553 RepID=UPI003C531C83
MNTLATIMRRRAALVAQAAAQRDEIGRLIGPWQKPLALVDRGIEIVQRLRAHPFAIAAGVALLVWMGRRKLSRWAVRIAAVWQLYSSLRSPRQ